MAWFSPTIICIQGTLQYGNICDLLLSWNVTFHYLKIIYLFHIEKQQSHSYCSDMGNRYSFTTPELVYSIVEVFASILGWQDMRLYGSYSICAFLPIQNHNDTHHQWSSVLYINYLTKTPSWQILQYVSWLDIGFYINTQLFTRHVVVYVYSHLCLLRWIEYWVQLQRIPYILLMGTIYNGVRFWFVG